MSNPSPQPASAGAPSLAALDAAIGAVRGARMASARAEHALDAFSQSVSHDLRAPVRAIRAYATALMEDAADGLTPEGQGFIERILASAATLDARVEALLRLSHLGRTGLRQDPVDLSRLAHRIVADLRQVEPLRAVAVAIAPRLEARGDAALLGLVLENLIGNAWKFTRQSVEARIELDAIEGGDGLVYRVADNGAGFDMSQASRLFVPFQRLHAATEYEGTGIGLASARRIVERHGGRIWASGRPGLGATFFFSLPRAGR